jgi:NitT/TauT family transport system substrate-binding protein
MPIEDIKLGLPYIDRNGELLASDIQTQIKWYGSHKFLEKDINPKDAVNTSFFTKALAK